MELIENNTKFKEYMELKNYSPLTMYSYLYYERSLLKLGEITQETINMVCMKHNNHVVRCFLKLYKECFKYGYDIPPHKKVHHDVMYDLGGYIDMEKIDDILSHSKNARDALLFLLMFRCGRRISEVLPLKAGDIDFKGGVILFSILKKRREYKRYKAIDSEVLKLLEGYIAMNKLGSEDYLFKSFTEGNHISRQRAHQIFREMCEATNVNRVGSKKPHTHHLRHSHAINFLKNVQSPYALKVLQQQLEHSNIAATSIYLQFSQKDQKEMLEKAFVKNPS